MDEKRLIDKDDNKLIEIVSLDFEKSEKVKEGYKAEWANNYRLYKSRLDSLREGRANVFVPYVFTIIESVTAKAIDALFNRKPYIGFAAMNENEVDAAKQMESLVYFQMKDKIDIQSKAVQAIKDTLIFGTSVGQYEWRYETKKVKKRRSIKENDIKIGEEVVEEVVDIYNDPDITFHDINSVFPDPEGYDVDSCSYIIVRSYKDKKYIKQKVKDGIWEVDEEAINGFGTEENAFTDFRHDINQITDIDSGERKKSHEILSYYTDDYIIEVLDRKHILRKVENPFYSMKKPFVRMVAYPDYSSFWGDSIVRIMSGLQENLNILRNARIDNISLVLNKVFLKNVSDDSLDDQLEDGELNIYPGKVLEVRDVERSLTTLNIPDITSSSFNEENIIKHDLSYISAVSEQSRGINQKARTTATELNIMANNSENVFNYVVAVIENSAILPLGEALKELNQQFITEEKSLRFFDGDSAEYSFMSFDPEEIIGDLDIVSVNPRVEAEATKLGRREQLLNMFQTFQSNPETAQLMNTKKFMEEILASYEIKDYKSLLIEPQPPMGMPGMEDAPLNPEEVAMAEQMAGVAPGTAEIPEPPIEQPPMEEPIEPQADPIAAMGDMDRRAALSQMAAEISNLPAEKQAEILAKIDGMGRQ